jgi:hypothetical protein
MTAEISSVWKCKYCNYCKAFFRKEGTVVPQKLFLKKFEFLISHKHNSRMVEHLSNVYPSIAKLKTFPFLTS